MNSKEILVVLVSNEGKEILKFDFEENLIIDLTSDKPEQLKSFFQQLLKNIEQENIVLKFDKGERDDLFAEVAEKYILHLQNEINSIYEDRIEELKK